MNQAQVHASTVVTWMAGDARLPNSSFRLKEACNSVNTSGAAKAAVQSSPVIHNGRGRQSALRFAQPLI
jgi:hypothetical protein